ncbi:MAG: replication initiator protein [Microvirus sp.]|nr:MAG: replication initiator protein [Microvirus sp.]
MPCYHELPAWESKAFTEKGKRQPVFNINDGYIDRPTAVPCGRCVGCRTKRVQEWTQRCLHEAEQHKDNCFITLTYDDNQLPDGDDLVVDHLQRFWKRLRRAGHTFRYFACGEYGPTTLRPHYHACLFGYYPNDSVRTLSNTLRESKSLDEAWGLGYTSHSVFNRETAAYVAGYILKKYTENGTPAELENRTMPFQVMSRRPAIGRDWALKWAKYITDHDGIRQPGGRLHPMPRYYSKAIEQTQPQLMKGLKYRRIRKALQDPNRSGTRRRAQESTRNARNQLQAKRDQL